MHTKTTQVTLLYDGEIRSIFSFPLGAQLRMRMDKGDPAFMFDEILIEIQEPITGQVVSPADKTEIERPAKHIEKPPKNTAEKLQSAAK